MIVYCVERLIEHSSAPAAFLSADTGDLSKKMGPFSAIFRRCSQESLPSRETVRIHAVLKSKSTSLELHLTRAQRYSLHRLIAASSASR